MIGTFPLHLFIEIFLNNLIYLIRTGKGGEIWRQKSIADGNTFIIEVARKNASSKKQFGRITS